MKRAESLRWIGLAAAQYARWHRLSDQFDFLVNELYPDALKLDPAYWPAHYEAGLLFLEKYNEADAAREFKAALEINPQAAEVHAALAALALENHNFEEAEASLHRALEINPRLLTARQIEADLAWLNLEVPETLATPRRKGLAAESRGRRDARPHRRLLRAAGREARGAGRTSRLAAPDRRSDRAEPARRRILLRAGRDAGRTQQAGRGRSVLPRGDSRDAPAGRPAGRPGAALHADGPRGGGPALLKEAFEADPFHIRVKNNLDVLDVHRQARTSSAPSISW